LPEEWMRNVFEIPWGKRHRIECNSLTYIDLSDKAPFLGGMIHGAMIFSIDLPESSVIIWKACEGHMYSLSNLACYISPPDRVWIDRYNKPVIATPTTLEEIDVYRTFL
jgi:hypothetical protein